MTWRNTDPFQDGMIKTLYYCNGGSYKTIAGARRNNPGCKIYLVTMIYEELDQ